MTGPPGSLLSVPDLQSVETLTLETSSIFPQRCCCRCRRRRRRRLRPCCSVLARDVGQPGPRPLPAVARLGEEPPDRWDPAAAAAAAAASPEEAASGGFLSLWPRAGQRLPTLIPNPHPRRAPPPPGGRLERLPP
ncbi:uncharacterized protein LOC144457478 [Phascolarctos cinereus]